MRRLAADAAWGPNYGDRATALSFVGFGLDVDAMTAMLRRCLLTDAEFAEGADSWHTLPDPSRASFPVDGHDQPAVTREAPDHTGRSRPIGTAAARRPPRSVAGA